MMKKQVTMKNLNYLYNTKCWNYTSWNKWLLNVEISCNNTKFFSIQCSFFNIFLFQKWWNFNLWNTKHVNSWSCHPVSSMDTTECIRVLSTNGQKYSRALMFPCQDFHHELCPQGSPHLELLVIISFSL